MQRPESSVRLPHPGAEHVRNIPVDIVATLFSCGLWNLHVQHRQMLALNAMLGNEKYRFLPWFAFTLLTCGLYHIYHEYQKSLDLVRLCNKADSNEAIACLILAIMGLSLVANALQQRDINQHFGGGSGL